MTDSVIRRKPCSQRRLGFSKDTLLLQRNVTLSQPIVSFELSPRVIRVEEDILTTRKNRGRRGKKQQRASQCET